MRVKLSESCNKKIHLVPDFIRCYQQHNVKTWVNMYGLTLNIYIERYAAYMCIHVHTTSYNLMHTTSRPDCLAEGISVLTEPPNYYSIPIFYFTQQ